MRVFSRNFAGDVTKEKCRLYHAALHDVDDEQLDGAVAHLIKEHRGEFIPTVAVVRDAIGANHRGGAIDAEATLRLISGLGEYHVDSGRWRYPTRARILLALGEGIADAFGEAGGAALLFSGNDLTREIATRDFVRGLALVAKHRGAAAIALPAPPQQPLLAAGAEPTL